MMQKYINYLEDTFELGDVHVCVVISLVLKNNYIIMHFITPKTMTPWSCLQYLG